MIDFNSLQEKLDALIDLFAKKDLLHLENIKSNSFLDEINNSDLMITLHDVDLYRPICINNKMAEFYDFDKNWLKGMDHLYYIKTIHSSTYYTLLESVSFFKKDRKDFLNLEYKLLYKKKEWKRVIGSTKTLILNKKGKPKYAITAAILNDNDREIVKGNLFHTLSDRETEIAKLLTIGLSKKEIADSLFIAESTVATHTKTIYKKLQINKISELIALTDKYPISS
ncbi:helix-turn-helix transcriptional regulator [Pseudopedobacter sp.]|uniref:helix-turn-helix transcriptional regulator n=1 Tax=Pseudopedobacter sp. TaxID=1936787 RepID=UPI00333FA0F8